MKAYYKRELLYKKKAEKNKTPAKKNTFFIERKKSDVKALKSISFQFVARQKGNNKSGPRQRRTNHQRELNNAMLRKNISNSGLRMIVTKIVPIANRAKENLGIC